MCVGVMGTALASPLYPLYQAQWGLRTSTLTQLFVVYMFGAMASLLFLGRATQRFGFLPVLRIGLFTMTGGVLLSMLSNGPGLFAVSRTLIGLASGMITTSSAIGLVRVARSADPKRTSAAITVIMTLGFGMGPLLGGLMAQIAPWPLRSAYLPTLLMGALACHALFKVRAIPRHHAPANLPQGWSLWLPRLALPADLRLRRYFWLGAAGAFSSFGLFSLYASLAPSFMQKLLPWSGPLVGGLSIATILFLSAGVQLAARPFANKQIVLVSACAMVAANLVLLATNELGSPLLFAASVLVTALAHGLANVGGMAVIQKICTDAERPTILASYLVVGYLGTIVPILAVGWLTDLIGLTHALDVFTVVMALLSAAIATLVWRTPPLLVAPGLPPA
ncbi:MFS transporter [Comamonas serinivorans]|uniref:MFS transporter n=2 Tax=Comamonas serinivorans TaxID=1082851 RepID=A0A1Y0ESS9_9BURK|nr:MFS transporter [Comamonas serinivorans]